MFCSRCGSEITGKSKFCPSCGLDLMATTPGPCHRHRARFRRPTSCARRWRPSTRSSRSWGGAGWRWSTAPGTASSSARWRSRCCPFSLAFDAEFVERFQREARTAAQLEHPNIIPIYRVGRSGRVIYFVMKFLRGGSLSTVLAERQEAHPARDPPAPARGRQRARLRGPAGHRAPRHQARQHHVRRVRAVRADRLRHRQGGVGPAAHRHGDVHRHARTT